MSRKHPWAALGGAGIHAGNVRSEIEKQLKARDDAAAKAIRAGSAVWDLSLIPSTGLMTRAEVAALLNISTCSVQRLEASGQMKRCPGLGTLVRYSNRDVLRFASAR